MRKRIWLIPFFVVLGLAAWIFLKPAPVIDILDVDPDKITTISIAAPDGTGSVFLTREWDAPPNKDILFLVEKLNEIRVQKTKVSRPPSGYKFLLYAFNGPNGGDTYLDTVDNWNPVILNTQSLWYEGREYKIVEGDTSAIMERIVQFLSET